LILAIRAKHVAVIGEQSLKERDYAEDLSAHERIILEWILGK